MFCIWGKIGGEGGVKKGEGVCVNQYMQRHHKYHF